MSYECRHLRGTFCDKRKKECDPGEPGCVLRGRVSFPLKEAAAKQQKISAVCGEPFPNQHHSLQTDGIQLQRQAS